MTIRNHNLLQHIAGSLFFLSLPILFSPDLSNPAMLIHIPGFQEDFISYLLLFIFFYVNLLILIPRFFNHKKYVQYVFICLIFLAIIIFLPDWLLADSKRRFFEARKHLFHEHHHKFDSSRFFIRDLKARLTGYLMALAFSFFLVTNESLKKIRNEKLNAEIAYLRAQINPHFLFNTLNSIYSLAIQKSDETPGALVKLSGMMRYVVSESNKDVVSLEKELNYIRTYIELQQLRLENTITIQFSVEGSTNGLAIAPLLLIPFIENAFKYGVNPEIPSLIQISVSILSKEVKFRISNKKLNPSIKEDEESGIGIENTRARLEHLYPGKHHLSITEAEDTFTVNLSIQLA